MNRLYYTILNFPKDGAEIQFGKVEELLHFLNDNIYYTQKSHKKYEEPITFDELIEECLLSSTGTIKIRNFFNIKIFTEIL